MIKASNDSTKRQKLNNGSDATKPVSDQKAISDKSQEEKKAANKDEEVKKEAAVVGTRRSARNEGKDLNYNIDAILDAAEEINGGPVGGSGISVMLAQTYDPEK
jgi:hypothetical protein